MGNGPEERGTKRKKIGFFQGGKKKDPILNRKTRRNSTMVDFAREKGKIGKKYACTGRRMPRSNKNTSISGSLSAIEGGGCRHRRLLSERRCAD